MTKCKICQKLKKENKYLQMSSQIEIILKHLHRLLELAEGKNAR